MDFYLRFEGSGNISSHLDWEQHFIWIGSNAAVAIGLFGPGGGVGKIGISERLNWPENGG